MLGQFVRRSRCVVWLAAWLAVSTAAEAQSNRSRSSLTGVQKSHAELRAEYAGQLQKVLDFCESKHLTDGAEEIARFLVQRDATALHAVDLPTHVEAKIPETLPEDERYWRTQLRFQRKEYAKQVYLLSRRALSAGHPGYAYELVRETAVHDPDHAQARKLLGYVQFGDEWVTPYARSMLQKGNVWHDSFGWLLKSHVARYEKGERNVDGKWMSAEKEAEIRRDFDHAWEIRTDHYVIRTNYSLERGVELGRALEDYYGFFHQTFVGFFNDEEQLQRIFKDAAPANREARPYRVNYYRSRDEYIQRLEKPFPSIHKTNGIYLTRDRTAHFYYDPAGDQEATLFHEATHQHFFESYPLERPIGETANFWIIEGIACYMESYRRTKGESSVGDPRYIRFAGARVNYIDQGYYVPLQEFTAMGMRDFQAAPMLAKNYTQAAGLAQFFMQYDDGRYRDALVQHLAQLYSASARKRESPERLDQLTGVEFTELDRQYGEFLRETQRLVQAGSDKPPETQ
jgi:hypothetical protein